MKTWARRLITIGAALVLRLLGQGIKERAKPMAQMIVIRGKAVPVADVLAVGEAFKLLAAGLAAGKSAAAIGTELKPLLLDVAEDVASTLVPGLGAGIALADWLIENSKPWTAEDTKRWEDRASGAGY